MPKVPPRRNPVFTPENMIITLVYNVLTEIFAEKGAHPNIKTRDLAEQLVLKIIDYRRKEII